MYCSFFHPWNFLYYFKCASQIYTFFRSSHEKFFVPFNDVLCALTLGPLAWLVHDINEDRSLCMTAQGIIHCENAPLSFYRLICPSGYSSAYNYVDSIPIGHFTRRYLPRRFIQNRLTANSSKYFKILEQSGERC